MLYDNTATDVLNDRPKCDICPLVGQEPARPAAVDGATTQGPWAYMCIPCHEVHGVGLGLGKGQRLLIDA